MKKEDKTKLSPGELEILEILWTDGDLTIRQTQEALDTRGRKLGYTTVQTRMDQMVAKGLLIRAKEYGGQYHPAVTRDKVTGKFFDLIEKLCRGNIAPLMVHLAGKRRLKDEEVATMRELLKQLDDEKKQTKKQPKK